MSKSINTRSYHWLGMTAAGQQVEGEISAPSLALAKFALFKQGIIVIKIYRIWLKNILFITNFSRKIKINFFKQMKNLLNAGISILVVLDIIHANEKNKKFCQSILQIKAKIVTGSALSEALLAHPLYFDTLCCNLIYAGEQTSQLSLILDKLVLYLEKMQALRDKVLKAVFYPGVVMALALLVTAGLCGFVVPQFQNMFVSLGAALPWITLLVIKLAAIFQKYSLCLVIIIFICGLMLRVLYKKHIYMQQWWQKKLLSLPMIGKVLRSAILVRTLYTLAIALQTGMPLPQALVLVAEIADNHGYRQGFLQIKEEVMQGVSISKAFDRMKLFPSEIVQMIAVSEQTGALAAMLLQAANLESERVDYYLEILTKLLEPAIMLVLSVVVGGLITAMYLPIFQLGKVV